ncbi:MAG: DUF6541 family protein [Candidatus Woesearchaeota archaeon]
MDRKDIITLAVLFIAALFLWTMPFQQNRLPFGEGDSAWHFSIGDYMHSSDRAISRLPFYVGVWYYNYNSILGPFALEYPPANHMNYAFMQFFGDRFVSVLMIRAITSFLGVFATYFLIRKLYGFLPAAIASLALVFSLREQMIYLWGQQPTLSSFVIIPVLLYSFYKYATLLFEGKPSSTYLFITAALIASQYMLHIQGIIVSLLAMVVFFFFMIIRHKRLPISKNTALQIGIVVLALVVVMLPFANIYLGAQSATAPSSKQPSRLLQWTVPSEPISGSFPAAFVQFSSEYRFWMLPLILLGVFFLLFRREPKDLLMLAWLASIYITFHLDVILGADWLGRIARMGVAEPPLFFSLMAIGLFSIFSLIKIPSQPRILLKYAVAIAVAVILVFTLGAAAKENLSQAYGGIGRITPQQLELAEWLHSNTAENSMIYDLGTSSYPKIRWLLASSQRYINQYYGSFVNASYAKDSPSYFIFDYSDLQLLVNSQYRDQFLPQLNQAQQAEQAMFANITPVYDKNNIRVYNVQVSN